MIIAACSERKLVPDKFVDVPELLFLVSNDSCKAPCTVNFISLSAKTDTVIWELGDGTTAKSKEVNHLYESAGNYTVTLTITNDVGISNDTSIKVSIFQPDSTATDTIPNDTTVIDTMTIDTTVTDSTSVIQASFSKISSSSDGVAPNAICFINTSNNATSYLWDFGDGQSSISSEDTVCHIFSEPGLYEVRLIAFSDKANDTSSLEIVINQDKPLPLAKFKVDNDSCIAPCSVELTNTSENANRFYWDFGNNDTAITDNSTIIYEYTNPGNYTIRLIAISEANSDTSQFDITILGPLPVADFEVLNDSCIAPCEVEFFNRSENEESIFWDLGNITFQEEEDVRYTFNDPGEYPVALKVSNASGTDITTKTITILEDNNPCEASILFTVSAPNNRVETPGKVSFTSLVEKENVNYLWQFGDDSTSQEPNPEYKYPSVNRNTEVEVTLTIDDGINTCSQTEILSLYNGPLPGRTVVTYLDEDRRIVHTSPYESKPDSTLVSEIRVARQGTILDLTTDYENRKLYILTGDGEFLADGGKNAIIWECNPNGTALRRIYEIASSNNRILNIEYDPVHKVVLFIEKGISVNTRNILKGYYQEDETIRNVLILEEPMPNIIDHFVIKPVPWELYYHTEDTQPIIRKHSLPSTIPPTPGKTFSQRGEGNALFGMAINPGNQRLYVSHQNSTFIEIFDTANDTGDEIKIIPTGGFITSRIALSLESRHIFWTEVNGGSISIKRARISGGLESTYIDGSIDKNTLQVGTFGQ